MNLQSTRGAWQSRQSRTWPSFQLKYSSTRLHRTIQEDNRSYSRKQCNQTSRGCHLKNKINIIKFLLKDNKFTHYSSTRPGLGGIDPELKNKFFSKIESKLKNKSQYIRSSGSWFWKDIFLIKQNENYFGELLTLIMVRRLQYWNDCLWNSPFYSVKHARDKPSHTPMLATLPQLRHVSTT